MRPKNFGDHRPLSATLRQLRAQNKKIVFTNGCFDLLHTGHLRLLQHCRRLGGYLIVGLNADRSVRRIKGPGRPVFPERDRAELLAGLKPVDRVVIFDETTPARIIRKVRPDILVKGGDWKKDKIIGRHIAGKIVRVPLVRGKSTTSIIHGIRAAGKAR